MILTERHQKFLTPEDEIKNRINSFRTTLQNMDISLTWIDHPTDLYYFTGSIQNGTLLIPTDGDPIFFVKKSVHRAEKESPLKVLPYPGRKGLLKNVKRMLGEKGRLGLAFEVSIASTYAWLLSKFKDTSVEDVSTALRLQKAVKSEWEIAQIKKATEQAIVLFNEMDKHIRPGITELYLAASIEARLRELGHAGTLYIRGVGLTLTITTVVSGESALYPINFDGPSGGEGPYPSSPAGAGWKKIEKGETVIIDLPTSYNGYYADNARIFYVGSDIPKKALEAHAFCLDVSGKIEQNLRPGRNCADIYREIHAWAEEQGSPEGFMGYGENRVKFFGHGVGLELDEFPIIADKIDLELKQGMVVALEPKAYLKGIGPVGVENTYVITENGCKNLCPFEQDIIRIL